MILSGGDPLVLVDSLLADLADAVGRHSTLCPAARPHAAADDDPAADRFDALLGWLRGTRLAPIMVIHANHPNELRGPAAAAIGRLVDAGIPGAESIGAFAGRERRSRHLGRALRAARRTAASCHIICTNWIASPGRRISKWKSRAACALIDELRKRLPGYAVPRYVRETAGEASKESLFG